VYNLNYGPTTLGVQSWREIICGGTRTKKVEYRCSGIDSHVSGIRWPWKCRVGRKQWTYTMRKFHKNSARFQASAVMYMRSALFWDITQRWVVILYRRFGTTYRFHLQEVHEQTGLSPPSQCDVLSTAAVLAPEGPPVTSILFWQLSTPFCSLLFRLPNVF
jgi:hypothetical protein